MERTEPPLVVIVGPTASGKTAAAIELAKEVGGEIICADSRTIYKSMDVGAAKPTKREQEAVPHWGIDLVEPDERFTVADFKKYALEKIADIHARDKVPLLVGGTGLYIDAILFDYTFGRDTEPKRRHELEQMSVERLQEYCFNNNISLPENYKNRRHLIRAIEQVGINKQRRSKPVNGSIIVGIATNKDMLRTKIVSRAEQILTNSVVNEAIELGKKYGWKREAMTGNIYPLIHSYLQNERSFEALKADFIMRDLQLAKRQLTWFRRNPYIVWLVREDVVPYIRGVLAS